MKKSLIIVLLLLVIVPGSLFAMELSKKSQNEILVFKNTVSGMSDSQKMFYLQQNEKSLAQPLLLNIFLGLGIGSFVEGDTVGGTTSLIWELASLSLYIYGNVKFILDYYGAIDAYYDAMLNGNEYNLNAGEVFATGFGAMLVGVISYLGARVFAITRPIMYTREYNRQLSQAVNPVQFGFVPLVDNEGNARMALSAKISY